MNTLDKRRLLNDLKDQESRRLFYAEHISTGLPFQIRELRKKRGMTQKKLSALTGFNQGNISEWENPNYEYTPQIGTLMRLADAFDVPLIVRFGSWDELWEWEWGMNLSTDKLAPPSFDEILPKLESEVALGQIRDTGKLRTRRAPTKDKSATTTVQLKLWPVLIDDNSENADERRPNDTNTPEASSAVKIRFHNAA